MAQRNLELALAHARAGRGVHAVSAHKKPLTPHGFHDATTDEATIREWWRRSPDALVATPTGTGAGIWVLDVDGMVGRDNLNGILATLGLERFQDLTPIIVGTPSGGLHLYFRCGPGEEVRTRAGDIAPGIDTRGIGGYIILPGNKLPDGRSYSLVDSEAAA